MTIRHRLHGIYRSTNEPSRMENRRRGGGNQCRKHRSTPRIRYPSTTAGAIRPARKRPATDQHAADGPAHDSAGGAGAPDAKELLVVAILHSCAVSQGGRDLQPIYEARRPLLWSMRNCNKKAPRDTSRRYPHLRQFQGVGQKSQEVDGETWYFTHCHLVGFRVSGNPIIINLAAHLVLAGTGDEIRYERILHF